MKKSHQFSLSVVALCIVQIGLQSRSLSIFDISVTKYDQTGLTNSQGGSSLGTRENRGGDVGSREITGIPRTVYMFWENGWHRAKREAVLSYLTWRDMNPGFRVMPLNGSQMELLSNRKMYIPDNVWQNTTVQGRSDVYRTLMVYKYGGIWADASLFCNVPVEEWLDLSADDLISFVRRNNLRQQSLYQIDPWITSWFLAAPKKSYVISKIFHVITDPKEFYRFSRRNAHAAEYFWWHKIVSDIASTDDHVRHRITHDFDYSDPNQCSGKNWTAYAKVLKVSHRSALWATKDMIFYQDTAITNACYVSWSSDAVAMR